MAEKIIENGSLAQKDRLMETLSSSRQFREQRLSIPEPSSSARVSAGVKQRYVYDAQNGKTLPGTLVRSEGDPVSGDSAVNEAYDGAGATFDLYYEIFERDSIDGNGMELISVVHYQQGYDNAFWNGSKMVYGDGDEDLPVGDRLFNRFTIAMDIIGHELTHGVTQYEADLEYKDQPGALNESFSDVFGSLVKQRFLNQIFAEADWLIGEGLFTQNVQGKAIRSMKDPGSAYDDPILGKDPQPGHMRDYVQTTSDNGGVHINSGIPNRAFYGVARELGGHVWERAGKIWYHTLKEKLTKTSDFHFAANATFESAGELFGEGSAEQNAVKKGWEEVGISLNLDKRKGCGAIFSGFIGGIGF